MLKIDSLSKTSANGVYALNGVTPDIPCGMKLHDWVEIGVFANGPSGRERDQQVLYLQHHHITTAAPAITVTVDARPDEAGVDPCDTLIDRVSEDHRRKVAM